MLHGSDDWTEGHIMPSSLLIGLHHICRMRSPIIDQEAISKVRSRGKNGWVIKHTGYSLTSMERTSKRDHYAW